MFGIGGFEEVTNSIYWAQRREKCLYRTELIRSFVIFDNRALARSVLSFRVPGCQKLQMTGLTRSGTGTVSTSRSCVRQVGRNKSGSLTGTSRSSCDMS